MNSFYITTNHTLTYYSKFFVKFITRKKDVVSPWTSGGLRAKQKSVGALCFRFHPKPLNTLTVAKLATQCTSWTLPFLLLVVWNKLPSLKMKWNFFHDFFPSAFNHKGPSSWVDDASFTESKYNRKKMDQLKGEKNVFLWFELLIPIQRWSKDCRSIGSQGVCITASVVALS